GFVAADESQAPPVAATRFAVEIVQRSNVASLSTWPWAWPDHAGPPVTASVKRPGLPRAAVQGGAATAVLIAATNAEGAPEPYLNESYSMPVSSAVGTSLPAGSLRAVMTAGVPAKYA